MCRKRNPELAKLMFGKEWKYDDLVWETFKRIIGDTSKIVYVIDSESQEVRLVYKITLFKDLSPEQLARFQFNFNYIQQDQKFHAAIKCNHAQTNEGNWVSSRNGARL